MASRTAAIRRSSERVEKFTELRELPGLSGSSERGTSFSITMGDGGPAREARLEELEGMVSLKSNCGEEEKDITCYYYLPRLESTISSLLSLGIYKCSQTSTIFGNFLFWICYLAFQGLNNNDGENTLS